MSEDINTGRVRRTLTQELHSVEVTNSDLANGVQATVAEQEAGQFFKTLRVNDFDFEAKRLGDSIVAQIEAEQEKGLGRLFG